MDVQVSKAIKAITRSQLIAMNPEEYGERINDGIGSFCNLLGRESVDRRSHRVSPITAKTAGGRKRFPSWPPVKAPNALHSSNGYFGLSLQTHDPKLNRTWRSVRFNVVVGSSLILLVHSKSSVCGELRHRPNTPIGTAVLPILQNRIT